LRREVPPLKDEMEKFISFLGLYGESGRALERAEGNVECLLFLVSKFHPFFKEETCVGLSWES
jgi:hypothetical protein